jgi:hypothetical protein
MMDRVKGWRLLGAVGVAMALLAVASLGTEMIRPRVPHTLWNAEVWPRLGMLLASLPVAVAALTTACLARPRRPERLAAVLGGFGWLLAVSLELWSMGFRPAVVLADALLVFSRLWNLGLPLAVGCWLGANYWRSGSAKEFRAGPGGAIISGGLVAGLAVAPLRYLVAWVQHVAKSNYAAAHSGPALAFGAGSHAVMALSTVASAAVITALLVHWRPTPWRGAFAGSGIAAGVVGLMVLGIALAGLGASAPVEHDLLRMHLRLALLDVGVAAIRGAIAGSFAGRWQSEGDA